MATMIWEQKMIAEGELKQAGKKPVDAEVVPNGDPDAEERRELQAERLNRRTKVRVDGQGPAEILAQPQTQGQSIPPEEGTKATKGKGNSPRSEGTKEEQEKVFVKGRSKIGPRIGSRAGTPRAPALAKKVIKGSAGADGDDSGDGYDDDCDGGDEG